MSTSESPPHCEDSQDHDKPMVSIVVPAYNEETIIRQNLTVLYEHMQALSHKYRWEIIVVNDGSTDKTGEIADTLAEKRKNVKILHHNYNFRLGQALRYGFQACCGDYVITLDVDLSYSPDHIDSMLTTLQKTGAKVVIASPYMEGGKVSNVPWLRKTFSIWANRFLSLTVTKDRLTGRLSTLTGMVRAYDRRFLAKLNLKAMDVDINPEILYKTMVLRGRIVEMPAHLNWCPPKTPGQQKRRSSINLFKAVISSLLSGFMFRPFMFFIVSGVFLLLLSAYALTRALFHILHYYGDHSAINAFSQSVALALKNYPTSFLVGGFTLFLGIQLLSLGIMALQTKKYFEELFYLGSSIHIRMQENHEQDQNQ